MIEAACIVFGLQTAFCAFGLLDDWKTHEESPRPIYVIFAYSCAMFIWACLEAGQ